MYVINKSDVAQFVQNIPNEKKLNIEIIIVVSPCGAFLYCMICSWLCKKVAYQIKNLKSHVLFVSFLFTPFIHLCRKDL